MTKDLQKIQCISDEQCDPSKSSTVSVASRFVEYNESLPRTVFYEMCSCWIKQKLFNLSMRYSQELQLNKRNYLPELNPFHILLSGGAGVGILFLTKLITVFVLQPALLKMEELYTSNLIMKNLIAKESQILFLKSCKAMYQY